MLRGRRTGVPDLRTYACTDTQPNRRANRVSDNRHAHPCTDCYADGHSNHGGPDSVSDCISDVCPDAHADRRPNGGAIVLSNARADRCANPHTHCPAQRTADRVAHRGPQRCPYSISHPRSHHRPDAGPHSSPGQPHRGSNAGADARALHVADPRSQRCAYDVSNPSSHRKPNRRPNRRAHRTAHRCSDGATDGATNTRADASAGARTPRRVRQHSALRSGGAHCTHHMSVGAAVHGD